jgi:hypothetical protein
VLGKTGVEVGLEVDVALIFTFCHKVENGGSLVMGEVFSHFVDVGLLFGCDFHFISVLK